MTGLDLAAEACRKLLTEIDGTLRPAPTQMRCRIFGRVTDLFVEYADSLDAEAVRLFDEVFLRQTGGVDTDTLAAAAARLAPLHNAPPRLIRTLSQHGVAAAAAPVLTHSPMLSTSDLVAIAGVCSQDHLMAIAQRAELPHQVTQVLIEIGQQPVMNQLATNPGAHFLIADWGAMLGRAASDERARVVTRTPVRALRLGGGVAAECMMLDVSPGGAKLNLDVPANVPELFMLELTNVEARQIQCRAVWRRGSTIGLRFTSSLVALWDPEAALEAETSSMMA
jgi:hypothetical protein